jgi:hypothetical protein
MSVYGKTKIYEIPDTPTGPTQEGLPSLLQSNYKFESHVFPSDLGSSDNGHYVVFNINVQVSFLKGAIGQVTGGTNVAGSTWSRFSGGVTPLNERSKVDQLRLGQSAAPVNTPRTLADTERFMRESGTRGGWVFRAGRWLWDNFVSGPTGLQTGAFNGQQTIFLERSTRRIAESIALHMPTPLIFNTHNVYEEISLTALGGKAIGVATGILARGPAAALTQSAIASGSIGTAAKLLQRPINPMLEILFSTTAPRQFTFEVLMAPRSEQESVTMKNIIKAFRYHAAPEIQTATLGLTWIPPAEFDITFFNKGVENTNITRINTCVLERIEVDYAPTSGVYATFRNGHPVAARMSLGFRELEPVHKERVLQGF